MHVIILKDSRPSVLSIQKSHQLCTIQPIRIRIIKHRTLTIKLDRRSELLKRLRVYWEQFRGECVEHGVEIAQVVEQLDDGLVESAGDGEGFKERRFVDCSWCVWWIWGRLGGRGVA